MSVMATEQVAERPNVSYGSDEVFERGEILRTVVGSGLLGIALEGLDDHDEMGIYIEPPEYVVGYTRWSYTHNRELHGSEGQPGMPHHNFRTQPEGARSGPGDTDRISYSLRRYVQLAIKGNPTALLPLFAPEEFLIVETTAGQELRELRYSFMSLEAVQRFLGYMHSQRERMNGGGRQSRVPYRPELIEAHGWDTKFGAHALRLAMQGYEVALYGHLTLPIESENRETVLAVKRGEIPREEVDAMIENFQTAITAVLDNGVSPLDEHPNYERIEKWVMHAHRRFWRWDAE